LSRKAAEPSATARVHHKGMGGAGGEAARTVAPKQQPLASHCTNQGTERHMLASRELVSQLGSAATPGSRVATYGC